MTHKFEFGFRCMNPSLVDSSEFSADEKNAGKRAAGLRRSLLHWLAMLALTAAVCSCLLMFAFRTLRLHRVAHRLPYPTVWVSPPNVIYHMVFDDEYEMHKQVNAQGLAMDRIVSWNKDRLRVVCVGDSQTFGYVDNHQTWPAQLEKLLTDAGVDADVVNLGKPGAGPHSYAMILEHVAPHFSPDVVVIASYSGNDASDLLRELSSFDNRELLLGPDGEIVESAFVQPGVDYTPLGLRSAPSGLQMPEVIHQIRAGPAAVLNGARFGQLRGLFELDVIAGGQRLSKTTTVTSGQGVGLCALFGITQLEAVKNGSFDEYEIPFKLWYSFHRTQLALREHVPRPRVLFTVLPTALQTGHRHRVHEGGLGVVVRDLLRLRDEDLNFEQAYITDVRFLAKQSGFGYVDVVSALSESTENLFYDPDSHYTAVGNRAIAEILLPAVIEALKRASDTTDAMKVGVTTSKN